MDILEMVDVTRRKGSGISIGWFTSRNFSNLKIVCIYIFMFVRKAVALGIPSAMNLSRVNDLCIRSGLQSV